MPSDTDIAWLAGLLEGEGCFSLNRDKRGNARPRVEVSVGMSDPDVVVRAGHLMEAVSVRRKRDTRHSDWSDIYVARVSGAKAERVMRLVLAHMGTRRSAKINELLGMENLSHHDRV